MIKVYITEDHEMYLEGLTLLLSRQNDISVVGSSKFGQALISELPKLEIDILLLDVQLPDAEPEELIQQIRTIKPSLKIIYLTLMRGTRFIHRLMKFDIQGYILKSAPFEELLQAIETVATGGTFYSKDVDITVKDDDHRQTLIVDDKKIDEILTKREIEILKLVCKEYSNSEIAEKLFLSVGTVETHRKNLIAKLGVNNTVGLVKYALRNNLIE
jgi:two-component system response regulator NreC